MPWNGFCMIPLISKKLEHMDSHVENGLQKIQKWGKNLMTGMPWNGFCMIPLILEFLEHMGSHVENGFPKI